jgi:hypothetical protein
MMPKQWRTLAWLPGYEISEDGDVRHTTAKATRPRGYVLKGCFNSHGYRVYKLVGPGGKRVYSAHRLVCEAFHGSPPTPKHHAAHGDGSPANNHFSNLRWASCKDNLADRAQHGTEMRGERNGRAKLTAPQVEEIRSRFVGRYGQIANLSREYGLSHSAMFSICHGENWNG